MSVKRLINFLRNEELDPYVIEWTTELDSGGFCCFISVNFVSIDPIIIDAALSLRGASFSWDSEKQCTPTLSKLVSHAKLVLLMSANVNRHVGGC